MPDQLRELLAIRQEHRQDILTRTEKTLAALSANVEVTDILRELHTEKGLARTLGLKELSQHIHQLETILLDKNGKTPIDEHVRRLSELLQEYQAFASVLREASSSPHGATPWLGQILDVHLAAWQKQLADEGLSLAELMVWDGVVTWNPRNMALARDICLHAITNSFDHGFIFPRKRGKTVSTPIITVQAKVQESTLHLHIYDNGNGLDLERIQTLAREKGFVPRSHETITDVIFSDGASSADQLTLSSGRGIGLSAVKRMIEAEGGRVHLQNNLEGPGTHLHAQWPLNEAGL